MSMFNLEEIIPNVIDLKDIIIVETITTIKMVVVAGFISFIFGLLMAIGLVLFRKDGLMPKKFIFQFFQLL